MEQKEDDTSNSTLSVDSERHRKTSQSKLETIEEIVDSKENGMKLDKMLVKTEDFLVASCCKVAFK